MSTISVSHAHCGAASKSICPNRSRNEGQGVHGPTIGRSSTGSGTFCGQAASGKQSIAIGSAFPAVSCMNGSKHGNSRVSGTRSCKRWFASTTGSAGFVGNGRLSTANRYLLLWAERLPDEIRPTAVNAGQRFISWLTSAAPRWRFILPVLTNMINGRLMTLSFPLWFRALRKNSISAWTKGMISTMSMISLPKPIIRNTLPTDDVAANHCLRQFRKSRSTRHDVGSWKGRLDGWPKDAAFAPDGARNARIGWPLYSSLVRISCAI